MIYNLSPTLDDKDIKALMNRFHFDATDYALIKVMYQAMLPLVKAKAYYSFDKIEEIKYKDYATCVISLGKGVDELSELYLSHEQVQEGYIIDCLGLELLSKAYEELLERLEEELNGLYVERLSFLGDDYPITLLPKLFEVTKPKEISYNDSFFMIPSKSASFILPLTSERKTNTKDLCNTCATCKNLSCPSRKGPKPVLPRTYGNMQIFHV